MIHVDVSDDGMLFHAQELVEGEPLQRSGSTAGTAGRRASSRASSPSLCDALAAAHAVGVVHRDVKPANVMITRAAPGLRLLDFGISKLYEDGSVEDGATRSGVILGTPPYMAPEQLGGARDVADRADVYAVGVILFQLLTGRLPFEDDTPRGVLLAAMLSDAPDVRSLSPDTPLALSGLVARCLEKNPSARPSAQDLARELADVAAAEGVASVDALEREGALRPGLGAVHADETLVAVVRRRPA